jgi:hypothetical protein
VMLSPRKKIRWKSIDMSASAAAGVDAPPRFVQAASEFGQDKAGAPPSSREADWQNLDNRCCPTNVRFTGRLLALQVSVADKK